MVQRARADVTHARAVQCAVRAEVDMPRSPTAALACVSSFVFLDPIYTIQPVVKPVEQPIGQPVSQPEPVGQPVISCKWRIISFSLFTTTTTTTTTTMTTPVSQYQKNVNSLTSYLRRYITQRR